MHGDALLHSPFRARSFRNNTPPKEGYEPFSVSHPEEITESCAQCLALQFGSFFLVTARTRALLNELWSKLQGAAQRVNPPCFFKRSKIGL